ncbi:hypothetical protein J4417_00415 [Candidatus Woesearchaeota archaeon]|nr:hypothetical protein [Candidatus Woesearchaeota archaeon]
MASIPIDLPKKVTGETLEEACIRAAEKMGYKAKPTDRFRKRYSLGSIQEHRDYDETIIRIGNLFPALHVVGIEKGKEQNRFFVWTELPYGIASNKKVEAYLSMVSKYLQ